MKKILFLLAISSLTACQKAKNTTVVAFDMPYSQAQALSLEPGNGDPIAGAGATMSFAPVTVATNARPYFDKYGTNSQNIESTYLGGMNLQIPTPGNHYFDFADKLELYISGNGQPEVLVAAYDNIPKGLKTINLNLVPGINLKNYIVNDSITVRLNAHVNFIPSPGAQILSTGDFQITAKPIAKPI